MGGLVLALIVGALVPPLVVSLLASRDPLPRNCSTGPVSSTRLDGAILRSTGADLWYSEGYPGQPRKLVDFAPAPSRLTPAASPSASSVASPTPVSASPSPGVVAPPTPRVVAADISADRRLVALLVVDPPDRPGFISLRLLSPLDQPAKAPVEAWYTQPYRQSEQAPAVRVLDNNKVLLVAGVPRSALTPPSPAVSPAPSASPSPGTPASASPSGSPSPSPSASAGAAVVVVVDPATAKFVDVAPLDYFLAVAHSGWPDTRGYRVPQAIPTLPNRVDGPTSRVAGTAERDVDTPLAHRHLTEIVVGAAGHRQASVVCAADPGTVPSAFSPDEAGLAIQKGGETWYLDLSGTHAPSRLVDGKILSWRA